MSELNAEKNYSEDFVHAFQFQTLLAMEVKVGNNRLPHHVIHSCRLMSFTVTQPNMLAWQ
jgi:hypothetical protein